MQWTAYHGCFFVIGGISPPDDLDSSTFGRVGLWLSFVLLLSGLLIFQGHWLQWPVVQEPMVAVGAVLILAAALAPGSIETMLLKEFPCYLGKISFSLYLVDVR